MPEIKNATPTWYNGVKYRSKLEAKCAEILDKANGLLEKYEEVEEKMKGEKGSDKNSSISSIN